MMTQRLSVVLFLCVTLVTSALAGEAKFGFERDTSTNIQQPRPAISIIIDDLGAQLSAGKRAVALPGAVTYAFLPHTRHATHLAELAHKQNKEVMIHMPMQAIGENNLGEGGLTLDMSQQHFVTTLKENLSAIPHISGINNHMGSLLTQHPEYMHWLMATLSERNDLFFVDSRTTEHTVAYQMATAYKIPSINRNVFLDNVRDEHAINKQFNQLIRFAKRHGTAVAIGHPYPETIAFLEQRLPMLEQQGVELIKTSALIKRKKLIEVTIPQAMFAAQEARGKIDQPQAQRDDTPPAVTVH